MTSIKSNIPVSIIQLLTAEQAWHYNSLPFQVEQNTLHLYSSADRLGKIEGELRMLTGKQIQIVTVEAAQLQPELTRYYSRKENARKVESFSLNNHGQQDFLSKLLNEAQNAGSSDIHLEPYEKRCRIRFRIDGHLVEKYQINKEEYSGLINKIKIQASLDISEKRLPQDGRIIISSKQSKIDLRVSVLPTLFGEKVVLRLLNSDIQEINLDKVGMDETQKALYLKSINKPNGIILISGPTGSGKTTTLYSTLKLLNQSKSNILTIEDPVEYTLEGINQVPLKEQIGLTFPKALRSFLRQDPDIIMVGEIRDKETADMAIRASLTGHLVFSTIHTNSAAGTINRLIDMGVPSFLIADTLVLSMAQRLIRLLCNHCKTATHENAGIKDLGDGPLYEANGCDHCHYTGYKGRTGIFELIEIDEMSKNAIRKNELQQFGEYRSLRQSAIELVRSGQSSLTEVFSLLQA
jgi:type IV pilus assembly protein PilB